MVLLEPGEVQIAIVPARYRGIAGALTLTDRHLVFERTTGVVSKRIRTIFSLPLKGIDSVSIEGEPQRTVLVVTTLRGEVIGPPRHEVHVDHAEGLEPEIRARLAAAKAPPVRPPSVAENAHPIHITIHTPPAAVTPPQVMVRCPYCKTVYPELAARCPSCGGHF
jgi:hypothetical protein